MSFKTPGNKQENWDLYILKVADRLVKYFIEVKEDPLIAGKFLGVATLVMEKYNGGTPRYLENTNNARLYIVLKRMAKKGVLDPQLVVAIINEIALSGQYAKLSRTQLKDVLVTCLGVFCGFILSCF